MCLLHQDHPPVNWRHTPDRSWSDLGPMLPVTAVPVTSVKPSSPGPLGCEETESLRLASPCSAPTLMDTSRDLCLGPTLVPSLTNCAMSTSPLPMVTQSSRLSPGTCILNTYSWPREGSHATAGRFVTKRFEGLQPCLLQQLAIHAEQKFMPCIPVVPWVHSHRAASAWCQPK